MKFLSILFSALSLVAFAQAAAVIAERDLATQHVGVCPAGTAQIGKTKGYHDESVNTFLGYRLCESNKDNSNCRFDDECCSKSCETVRGHCR